VRRPRTIAASTILLALALGGCGVGTQSSAVSVERRDVPFDLLDPITAPAASPEGAASIENLTVFMVRGDRLVPVGRSPDGPISPQTAMAALARGPSDAEVAAGVQSAVGPSNPARSVQVEEHRVVVDLDGDFLTAGGDQIVGIAQIVFTLTTLIGIDSVQFRLEGEPVEVPLPDGVLTADPVRDSDYLALAPAG
jgi:hypothetical protein